MESPSILYSLSFLLIGQVASKCSFPIGSYTQGFPLVSSPDNVTEILYPSLFSDKLIIETDHPFLRISCPLGRLTANSSIIEKNENVGLFKCTAYFGGTILVSHWGEYFEFQALGCEEIISDLVVSEMTSAKTMRAGIRVSLVQSFDVLNFEFDKDLFHADRETTVSATMRQYLKPPLGNYTSAFFKGAFYERIDMNLSQIFQLSYQRRRFLMTSGNIELVDRYFPQNSAQFYLVEAQLISKNFLYYPFEQEVTFLYENVVPMWRTIRDGNWKLAEVALRMFAKQLSSEPVTLVAGTQGSLQIGFDDEGFAHPTRVYLKTYTNEIINTPEKVFKCVVDKHGNGIAIVVVNNPYQNFFNFDNNSCDKITKDCHKMYPDFQNFTRGFTYCCDVKDLPGNLRARCVARINYSTR